MKRRKHKLDRPWVLVIRKKKDEFATEKAVVEDNNPFLVGDKPKWTLPDGVLIHAALSFLARGLKSERSDAGRHMAVSAEAFGCQPGARIPTEEQLTRVASQVFAILTKAKRKKVCPGIHDLVFWPNFKGGFIHATHSPTY